MEFHSSILEKSPSWTSAWQVYSALKKAGFTSYFAGGCVRDAHLGLVPKDLDVVTDASVEEIEKLFEKVVLVGKSFGVIHVLKGEHQIEVAQFRKESDYKDGRHPSLVSAGRPEEDAARRDLTINALFYDPEKNQILDYIQGVADLKAKVIRCVGDAETRFKEDHLRLLRTIRFKNHLRFTYESNTEEAIRKTVDLAKDLSRERVQEELLKMFSSPQVWEGLLDYEKFGLLKVLFPERAQSFSVNKGEIQKILKLIAQSPKEDDLKEQQLLAFFWNMDSLEPSFERLRLDRRLERTLKEAGEVVARLENFFKLPRFEQWEKLKNDLLQKALSWKIQLGSPQKSLLQELLKSYEDKGLHLGWPKPLVTGEDLKSRFQGPSLGVALKKCYQLQIENSLTTKNDVMEYFSK